MNDEIPLFSWSEYDLAEAEGKWRFQVEREQYDEEQFYQYETEEDAIHAVYDDYDFWQWSWDDLVHLVEDWMERNEYYAFHCDAQGLGWRNQSGHNEFSTDDGAEFLRQIVGFDNATFKFWERKPRQSEFGPVGVVLTGNVYHHDSPMGESRQVWLMRNCDAGIYSVCEEHCDPEEMAKVKVARPSWASSGDPWIVCQGCLNMMLVDGDIEKVIAGHVADYNQPHVENL